MPRFQANFSYYPTVIFAPANVQFNNLSSIGTAIDDTNTVAIDSSNNIVTISGSLANYSCARIERYEWDFGDSTFANDVTPDHVFELSGLYPVKLSIVSEEFFDINTGIRFRIKNTIVQNVDVGLMSYAWLQQHMTEPHLEALNNSQGFSDLIFATSKMFDRMYGEIKSVADLMDVKKVAPKFLEYFSDTLNHQKFYAEKIGYAEQDKNNLYQGFLDYNIFDRINNGTAGDKEIETFRQFIIDTAKMFKTNGSRESMENFFKLYNFVIQIKDLWTTNFGLVAQPDIVEDFLLDPTLEKTKSKLKYRGISVTGFDNSLLNVRNNFNNITLDNYHFISRLSYPSDLITQTTGSTATSSAPTSSNPTSSNPTSSSPTSAIDDTCLATFPINAVPPYVTGIIREDGRQLLDRATCSGFSVNTNCLGLQDISCSDNNIRIEPNLTWDGANLIIPGVDYKFWTAPTNYVNTIINTVGLIPNGLDEIAETDDNTVSDTDDYLWADWNKGVTIPPTVVGLTQSDLKRPSWETILPFINYETSLTNDDLFQVANQKISTTNDFFVVGRGFIKIPAAAYYTFTLEIGNTGAGTGDQHVALFSLKHNTIYTTEMINAMNSLDGISFSHDNTDVVSTFGTSGEVSLYSKAGEYGIIEIRQNEISERSGDYYLEPGYYAIEIKAAYSSLASKKLKLYWESFTVSEQNNTVTVNTIQNYKVIPFTYFYCRQPAVPGDIENDIGKGLLSIPNTLLEGGDNFIVAYSQSNSSNDNVSGIISTSKDKFKNLEINLRFSPEIIPLSETNFNRANPQNTIMVLFRAISRNVDLYSDFDTYYAVIINGNTGECGIAQVSYATETDGAYYRFLNLNPNSHELDKVVFQQLLLDTDNQIIKLQPGQFYDLKVNVVDNKVSVYFRNNVQFTNAISNIRKSLQEDLINYADSDTFIPVITNLDLNQSEVETETLDALWKNLDVAEKYVPILEPGAYGFAIKSSIFRVEQFKITPLDDVDHKLETEDKWKEIKPKYLDSRNNNLLQYNSYGSFGVDKPISPTFALTVSNSYDGNTNVYEIPPSVGAIDDNSVDALYADNVTVNNWGTRFNVLVDKQFISDRFKNTQDILDNLVVPYGNFFEPYINWSRTDDQYSTSWQAGFTPFVAETAQILPHTVALSAGITLYPSEMVRNSNTQIQIVNPLADFINGTNDSVFGGLWEEICPNSVNETWTVATSSFKNPVLEPIYRNTDIKDEVIGVRILTSSIMDRLICRFCQDGTAWGLYEITATDASINNHPFADQARLTTFRYFVPIGKLNKDFFIFLPPAEILNASGIKLNLIGVFAHHTYDGFAFTDKVTININQLNPWENDYKSRIQCRYFIDIQTSFIDRFTQFSKTSLTPHVSLPCSPGDQLEDADLTACDLPNAFYLPDNISSLLTYLENNSDSFEADYNWWVPKTLWIKRKVSIVYPNNSDNVLVTGLNTPNPFYTGSNVITGQQGTIVALQDGFDADTGRFILDSSWCVNSVGWDAEFAIASNNSYDVGTFDSSAYNLFGYPSNSSFAFGTETSIPVGGFMNAPIPLETVTTSGQTQLLFGAYLQNEVGDDRTFSPAGLFNWFTTHGNANTNETAGWDITEWNDAFAQGFKFNNVFGEVDSSVFSINKYWSFYPQFTPPFSSIVEVEITGGNCSSVDGDNAPLNETKTIVLGVSDGNNGFYAIPPIIEYYPKWVQNIERVLVNHHSIDSDHFYVRINTGTGLPELVINNQMFDFSRFVGPTHFVIDFFNDKTFKLQENIIFQDDFSTRREINWITFLENNGVYQVAKRLPETELKFTGDTLPYEIFKYNNIPVYKLINKFDYNNPSKFAGTSNSNIEVGLLDNHGSINSIMLTDVESNNFTISSDIIFDSTITDTDLKKQFELILKAENKFIRSTNEWGIANFYFVGIGAFNFDIGLGMRSVDNNTGEVKETFLASFGDFNVRNIKAGVWYTLKAIVSNTDIKVIFHEKNQPERLVLDYNINKQYEKLTERYLKGEFETLQAIIIGLQELGITYPDQLGNQVSQQYTFDNFKAEFAATLPVNGYYSGFRTFNSMTYVTNVEYVSNIPKQYTFGSTFDGTSFDDMLHRINNRFALPPNADIKKVSQALNFTVFIQINDMLFYQYQNNDPQKYPRPIEQYEIVQDKIIIVEKENPTDSGVGLNDFSVGNNQFIWSLDTNTLNIVSLQDFFTTVPNISAASINRNSMIYTAYISGNNIIGSDEELEIGDTITLTITGNRNVVWPLNGELGRYILNVRVFQEGFTQEYPVLIKDKTFYKDGLKSYMAFADKNIKEVIINDGILHILFKDN